MYIYFVQAVNGGPVKIGVAFDPVDRLRALQTGNAAELQIIRRFKGTEEVEAWLHQHFQHLHIRGEWFSFDETMKTIVPPYAVAAKSRMKVLDKKINHALGVLGSSIVPHQFLLTIYGENTRSPKPRYPKPAP